MIQHNLLCSAFLCSCPWRLLTEAVEVSGKSVLQGKLLQVALYSCAPSLGLVLNQAPGFDPRGPDSPALHHLYRRVANKVSVLLSSVCYSPLKTLSGSLMISFSHKQQYIPNIYLFPLNKNIEMWTVFVPSGDKEENNFSSDLRMMP